MGFLLPSALALSALALPIIIFYMLKLRRPPQQVSSLLLWEQVLADQQANALWQRLKRNILLLLQLLILALLVMALARPYLTVEATVEGNVIILLDASASMQATDVAPTRFAVAKEAVRDLITRLDGGNSVSLIAVADTPRVLAAATTNRNQLRQALAAAQPTNGLPDWTAALTLAAANAATIADSTIVVVGDGGGMLDENQPLNLPTAVQFIPIGTAGDNQGLVALSLRNGADGAELFGRVFNASDEAVTRLVDIDVEGQIFDARRLEIPPRREATFTISGLPSQAQRIQANLVGEDTLSLDDTAWVVRTGRPTQILVVGEGNLFLERALALLPNVEIQRLPPDQSLPQTPFDITIFDRTAPDVLPSGNLMFIAPTQATPLFDVRGVFTPTRPCSIDRDDPLLVEVNRWERVYIQQSQAVDPLPWLRPLLRSGGNPLIAAGESEGRKVVLLAFDLLASDWPLQIEFPIFMVNATEWLAPNQIMEASDILRPGQPFEGSRTPSAETINITTPTGNQYQYSAAEPLTFGETDALGIYQVTAQTVDSSQPELLTEFAINLLSPTETDTAPVSQPPSLVATPPATGDADAAPLAGRWEWWPILALLGLGVLLAEWWVYWQGEV